MTTSVLARRPLDLLYVNLYVFFFFFCARDISKTAELMTFGLHAIEK